MTEATLFPNFRRQGIATDEGVSIHTVVGGEGPPLLLLHGHPQTHAIWHKVAPVLARKFTLVLCDLRGYGDSSKPEGEPDHANYSKRTMARDVLRVMQQLGHQRFNVLAHDRGARVAHRLAADHPEAVSRMVLLDIAPTLAMYEQTNEQFARDYWHWFFLIQPRPLPEQLIEHDPCAYMLGVMGGRYGGMSAFDPRALAEYTRAMKQPGAVHAVCEDYRAAASIDLEHDRADRERGLRLALPVMILWGDKGVIHRCFKPLDEWRRVADDVRGEAVPGGHYIPESAPDELLAKVVPFFTEGQA